MIIPPSENHLQSNSSCWLICNHMYHALNTLFYLGLFDLLLDKPYLISYRARHPLAYIYIFFLSILHSFCKMYLTI
jgi:hypothetical protein